MADGNWGRWRKVAPPLGGPVLPPSERRHVWVRAVLWTLVVVVAVAFAWACGLYDRFRLENLAHLQRWMGRAGPWAPILYVTAYVFLEVAFVPAFPMTILAGLAFGALWGTVYAWLGAMLSAALAFLITQHGGREMVKRWVAGHPRLARIDEAVARRGWRILAFTRLMPVFPFNLQNYAYGLTGIRFSTYLLVTAVFMLPGTAALTMAGDALAEGGKSYRWLGLYLGIAVVLVAVLWIVPERLGRRSGVTDELIDKKRPHE